LRRKVEFEKWRDPLVTADLYDEVYPPEEPADEYDKVRREFGDHHRSRPSPYSGPVWWGPAGIIPLGGHNLPGKNYNFWLAHTDRPLTPRDKEALDRVPGVEVLRVFTGYRLWFAVGRLFEEEDVKRAVERALAGPEPGAPRRALSPLARSLAGRHEHWAVVELGDGGREAAAGATWDEVESKAAGRPVVESSRDDDD
jgi:hypothetical protein